MNNYQLQYQLNLMMKAFLRATLHAAKELEEYKAAKNQRPKKRGR